MNTNKKSQKNRNYGIICIVLSALCFAFMNAFVRLSGDLPSVQKSFFRNFVAVIFAFVLLRKNRISLAPQKKENLKFLLVRAIAGTLGIMCNFYAIDHLVLSDASMLNKMSPFFAVVFSMLFLKEKTAPFQIGAVAAAFLGSLLIIKPSFSNAAFFPAFIGFVGGMAAGLAYTAVRHLTTKGEKGAYVVFFFSSFSCLATLPFLIFNYHPMTLSQLLCLLGAGLSASGGQFAITAAYSYAPAKEISVYDYSQIIFAAALGYFMFGQIPDTLSFIGYLIIVSMAVLMFFYNRKKSKCEK